jgi:hypothetical protein
MDELVAYLRARIAEAEAVARAASGATVVGEPGSWHPAPNGDEWEAQCSADGDEELLVALRPGLPRPPDVMGGMWGAIASNADYRWRQPDAGSAMPQLEHAARWDPARVLAECEAKRALIDIILGYESTLDGEVGCCHSADEIGRGECNIKSAQIPGLLALVRPYAGRPGFDPAWTGDQP